MPAILKSKKMSITQTYYLAHTARSKLSKEASRGDHDLRVLVGHANLLDGLMGDLATAERAQEVDEAPAKQHVTWAPQLPSPASEVSDAEVSDSDSDSDDEAEDIEIDDETDSSRLALVRTPSRSSPPELLETEDYEDDSDDDSMPPSPPAAPALTFSNKKTEEGESFYEDGFYLPRRGAVVVY